MTVVGDDGIEFLLGKTLPWARLENLISVDHFTGQTSARVPLPLTSGRFGFGPTSPTRSRSVVSSTLDLVYRSDALNSPFGFGWNLDLPVISRKTCPDVPRYRDLDDDIYELSGDELIQGLRVSGGWIDDHFTVGEYAVRRYKRRFESVFDRIELWIHQPSGQTHWRVIDTDNVTTLFGTNDSTRVSDPSDPNRVASWLIAERFDDKGNIVHFEYKHENLDGVDLQSLNESHRIDSPDSHGGMRYLKRIKYGNSAPHDRTKWHFEVVFDYGEHDLLAPTVNEDRDWAVRPDPFSSFRAGFENRTWRQLSRLLMFHSFDELGDQPSLVSTVDFVYELNGGISVLKKLTHTGVIERSAGVYEARSAPSLTFGYQISNLDAQVRELSSTHVLDALVDERASAHWVDVDGVGAPGLVARLATDQTFVRNLGDGRFAKAEVLSPDEYKATFQEVVDLDKLEYDPFNDLSHGAEYTPLATMRATSNVNQDDPYVGYIDLNGDSADDVVVADDNIIRWYPSRGEDGFGDPIVLRLNELDAKRAHCIHADQNQSFHAADLTGDGMLDLIRVVSDEVSYWPNQGRGRFGSRIVINNSPHLKQGSIVLFADLTASGVCDLVAIDDERIHCWINEQGNRFITGADVTYEGQMPQQADVNAVDLFGTGSDAVVWIDRANIKVRYFAPRHETPRLLNSFSNSMGAEARIAYATTSELFFAGLELGQDWLTAVSKPQNVAVRVDLVDSVSSTKRSRRFSYAHGYFDSDENAFAGFGYTSEWDGDITDSRLFDSTVQIHANRQRIPHVTRRWSHIGVQSENNEFAQLVSSEFFGQSDSEKTWLSGNQMPLGQSSRDSAEAQRSLRGLPIRVETYVRDGAHTGDTPVDVSEWSYWVRQQVPSRSGNPASYDVREFENVSVVYDNSDTPRIVHRATLALDDFGFPARQVEIAYGNQDAPHEFQRVTHGLLRDAVILNRTDQSTWYRVGVSMQSKTWDLIGLALPDEGRIYEHKTLRSLIDSIPESSVAKEGTQLFKKLIGHTRTRYWSNDLTQELPVGALESKALVARVEELTFTKSMARSLFEAEDDIVSLLSGAGYVLEGDQWWNPGETSHYDASKFYVKNASSGALAGRTKFHFDNSTLKIEKIEYPFGNFIQYRTHPRTLKSWLKTDVNGNSFGVRFDALGMRLSETLIGVRGDGQFDALALSTHEPSVNDNPTSVTTYDLDAPAMHGSPIFVRERTREVHADNATRVSDKYSYFDGLLRPVATAEKVAEDQWRITSLVERDSAGIVVREAEPFFSHTAWPNEALREKAFLTRTSFQHDGLGRVVTADFPDGTFSKNEYTAWEQIASDPNDTVLDSAWFADRHGSTQGRAGDFGSLESTLAQHRTRAAALAAQHEKTPTRYLFDSFGRKVVIKRGLSQHEDIENSFVVDSQGLVLVVVDSRGIESKRILRDMQGRTIRTIDIDSGTETIVRRVDSQPAKIFRSDGSSVRFTYDKLGRRTHAHAKATVNSPEKLREVTIWGGGEVSTPGASSRNLVDQPIARLTPSGLELIDACDPLGNVLRSSFYPAIKSNAQEVDLQNAEEIVHVGQMLALLAEGDQPILSMEPFRIDCVYDAIGRIRAQAGSDGTVVTFAYDLVANVTDISLKPAGSEKPADSEKSDESSEEKVIVENANYDASNRLTSVQLGNGAKTNRVFDVMGNITEITTASPTRERPIQDLRMVHDAVGNLMSYIDKAQLMGSYTYDSLNRLKKVESLEPVELSDGRLGARRFTRVYKFDSESNLLELEHKSGQNTWVKRFGYEHNTNRLTSLSSPTEGAEQYLDEYQLDARGRLTQAPEMESFAWDESEQLVVADRAGGTRVSYGYNSSGSQLVHRVVNHVGEVSIETIFLGLFERTITRRNGTVVQDVVSTSIDINNTRLAVFDHVLKSARLPEDEIGTTLRYQLTDHLGSVVAELSEEGDVITQEWFLPEGETLCKRGRSLDEVETKKFGFEGLRQDVDPSLLFRNGRWYSTKLFRYLDSPY